MSENNDGRQARTDSQDLTPAERAEIDLAAAVGIFENSNNYVDSNPSRRVRFAEVRAQIAQAKALERIADDLAILRQVHERAFVQFEKLTLVHGGKHLNVRRTK